MAKIDKDKNIFINSAKKRDALTKKQMREIRKIYLEWAEDIAKEAKKYERSTLQSDLIRARQLRELEAKIKSESEKIMNRVYNTTVSSMQEMADKVIEDNNKWLNSLGFDTSTMQVAMTTFSRNVVDSILLGDVYTTKFNLAKSIWGDNETVLKEIHKIIAGGIAENKSVYEITKDIEKYIKPGAKKNWNLRDKDGKLIYPKFVDYNAQRLVRTLIQHAYQKTFVETTINNPFITKYRWNANGSRVCPLCRSRDGQIYRKDELPLDHPNGMCTMEPVLADDYTKQMANWFNSPEGTYPELDDYFNNLYKNI